MYQNKPSQNKKNQNFKARLKLTRVVFILVFSLFVARSTWLTLMPFTNKKLLHISKNQYHKSSSSVSSRGSLYDHKKVPLAISIKAPSLAINPRVFQPSQAELQKLSKLLSMSVKKIKKLSQKKSYFAWIKRKTTYALAEQIKALKINGLYHVLEPSRFYPGGNSGSHLIGLVGTDNVGLLGLEKTFDSFLSGSHTEGLKLKDARGISILTSTDAVAPQQAGHHVYLTIDHVIQEITEEALDKMYQLSEANSAFAIVSDPHTGRILAMANRPAFNPNETESLDVKKTKNLAIHAAFEPGSVIKPFHIATALEQKKTSLEELHDCEPTGRFQVSKSAFIHDDHPKNFPLTTAEVLIHSSNICAYKLAQKIGKEELYKTFKRFGLGEKTPGIKLPGLAKGSIAPSDTWREIRFANVAFGQGFLTTGPEMIRAFSALANGGFLVEPYLISRIETADGDLVQGPPPMNERRILSEKIAEKMREALLRVVLEGTGKNARLESFSAAGKTGTAEKVDPITKTYSPDKRIASFIGFAPAHNPHLVAYIVIDEPHKKPYYGGTWAAPAFKDIMEKSLKYLNIAPDNPEEPVDVNLSKQKDHEDTRHPNPQL